MATPQVASAGSVEVQCVRCEKVFKVAVAPTKVPICKACYKVVQQIKSAASSRGIKVGI